MTLIYSTKKLFGGYKIASSDMFGANTRFKGDYFDFFPEKDGVRVVSKDGSFSRCYENVRHLTGLNFFVCDNEDGLYGEIYERRNYVDDEIYHLKAVCDSLTGKTIYARRIHKDYIVDEYDNIYFVQNGTISREPFETKADVYNSGNYTSHDGEYLIVKDSKKNVSIVSSKGEYVLKNVISGDKTIVQIHGKEFPGNKTTCYVQNDKVMSIVSERGVIYETNHEPYKTLNTGVVGDKFFINEYSSGESTTTKMMIFDSNNKKIHELMVPKSLWEVKEVEGEIVFVFAEGPFRSQKITEVKLADYIASQSKEIHESGEKSVSKKEADDGSKTIETKPKKAPTQLGE